MGGRIYINNRPPHVQFLSTHRSVRLHRKPSIIFFDSRLQWECKRIRFNGDIATAGHRILSVFISTTEHGVTRAFRNANRARVTSQLFCPEGGLHSCLFIYLFIYFLFVFVIFVYQAKIIQHCFYHKPLKYSTTWSTTIVLFSRGLAKHPFCLFASDPPFTPGSK